MRPLALRLTDLTVLWLFSFVLRTDMDPGWGSFIGAAKIGTTTLGVRPLVAEPHALGIFHKLLPEMNG
jgi:hypothetical protein